MPVKNVTRTPDASQYYKNVSFETLAASWFSSDGWEVLMPLVDHGMKTDLVIADQSNFYRIQIKTIDAVSEEVMVENKWGDVNIDFIVYFARNSNWGYIAPTFNESRKRLNSKGHVRFHQDQKPFIKAFAQI
ncbi:MAG: hypothetical protein KBT66_09410 [Amphritea sp.]|nr:hypothetical protein [Amphritea sp.]